MRPINADALKDEFPKNSDWEYPVNTNEYVCETIDAQPTIEPEREKGAWINEGRIIRCNRCKIGYAAVKGMKSALTYNFCPSCGADMRGEQDERSDKQAGGD